MVNNYKAATKSLLFQLFIYFPCYIENDSKLNFKIHKPNRTLHFIAEGVNSVSLNPQLLLIAEILAYISRYIH